MVKHALLAAPRRMLKEDVKRAVVELSLVREAGVGLR